MDKNTKTAGISNSRSSSTVKVHVSDVVWEEAEKSVGAFLGNVRTGSPIILTSGFAHGLEISDVLDEWESKMKATLTDSLWQPLLQFENDLKSKVGPLSWRANWYERADSLSDYYNLSQHTGSFDEEALKLVLSEFSPLNGLTEESPYKARLLMKKSTSAGLPTMLKRRRFFDDGWFPYALAENTRWKRKYTYTQYRQPNSESVDNCRWYMNAALPGWRGQEGGPSFEDVKQRLVWMFPVGVNLMEACVYDPLILGAQNAKLIPAWVSNAEVDHRITQLFDTKDPKDPVVGTDFSKFDQHFNPVLQNVAQTILECLFGFTIVESGWSEKVFPIKYNIPMLLPYSFKDGMCWLAVGPHGMASGSKGTNADETLSHRYLQYAAALSANSELNQHSQCLGDDGIISYPGIKVEDVIQVYEDHGQEMNPSKQYVANDHCVYLRRIHLEGYRPNGDMVGIYSTLRALGKLKYVERDISKFSDIEYVIRELSIIENCKWHPMFREFVEFCRTKSKFGLGTKLRGGLDAVVAAGSVLTTGDRAEEMIGYNAANMSEAVPLRLWETVRILRGE